MKKYLIMLMTGFTSFYAQIPATISSRLDFGTQSVYFVKETNSAEYYKTVVTPINNLVNNQPVEINASIRPDGMVSVNIIGSSSTILTKKMERNLTDIGSILNSKLPVNTDGILYFNNKVHFDEVYTLVQMLITTTRGDLGTMSVIRDFNNKFINYISFTEYYEGKYDFEKTSYSSEQMTLIENEDFINDEILKTFLNEYRLVGVGDSIYHYFDHNTIVYLEKADLKENLQILKDLRQSTTELFSPSSSVMLKSEFFIK